ncbi:uncharacterized protein [Narcine bancroftii]|uniref:uncharacterized protein n=1 Tax=Narcine bancroftii TaxID=1343680 RepID=UPI00383148B6
MILLSLLGVTLLSEIFAWEHGLENLVMNGIAIQSSTGLSVRAFDGSNSTEATKGHCMQTQTTNDPWWRLELRGNYAISAVRIINRRDCCLDQILGAQIRIGNSLENHGNSNRLCAIVQLIDPNVTYACKGFLGRYVNIIVPGYRKNVAFCEVEVLGLNIALPEDAVGMPLGAAAFQSSVHSTWVADRAVDGNKSPDARHHSCSETRNASNPWWTVDLEETYNVSVVSITNRRDCCSDGLLGAEIHVGNTLQPNRISSNLCGIVKSVSRTTITFNCGGLLGRYVTIVQPGLFKILTLCEVEIFGSKVSSPEHAAGNLAFGRKALQSYTNLNRVANRAINGEHIRNGTQDTCSQTKSSKNPWWRVNLMRSYVVTRVKISHGKDCCKGELSRVEVRVGDSLQNNGNSNSLCGRVQSVSGTITIGCDRLVGRYVNIVIPGHNKMLTLCKVEVFGTKIPSLEGAVSLTMGGAAIQSSTDGPANAERAIDGNKKSCSQTKETNSPWWTVDLRRSYLVSLVRITGGSDQLLGAQIHILNSFATKRKMYGHCGSVQSVSGKTLTFSCNGFMGRYVHISISGRRKVLALCEVEVYGSEITSSEETVNLALKGMATQSSTDYSGRARFAIDGDRTPNMRWHLCAHTRKSRTPWWRLDLRDTYFISFIRITNRMDCCSKWIVGAEVRIGNSRDVMGKFNKLCATIQFVAPTYTFQCDGLSGRYVNIVIPGKGKILNFCEVEVFGTTIPLLEDKGKLKPSLQWVVLRDNFRPLISSLERHIISRLQWNVRHGTIEYFSKKAGHLALLVHA